MEKKTCIVTGAAGFIGSNLINEFLSKAHTVIAVDNLLTGKLSNLDKALSSIVAN